MIQSRELSAFWPIVLLSPGGAVVPFGNGRGRNHEPPQDGAVNGFRESLPGVILGLLETLDATDMATAPRIMTFIGTLPVTVAETGLDTDTIAAVRKKIAELLKLDHRTGFCRVAICRALEALLKAWVS